MLIVEVHKQSIHPYHKPPVLRSVCIQAFWHLLYITIPCIFFSQIYTYTKLNCTLQKQQHKLTLV